MRGSGSTRYHRRNKDVRKLAHHKVRPFIKSGTMRPCEGQKIGAFDSEYLAVDFSKGDNLLKNGDFESDDHERGLPDNWTVDIGGKTPKHAILSQAAAAGDQVIHVTKSSLHHLKTGYESVLPVPVVFEPIITVTKTKKYPHNNHNDPPVVKSHRHKRKEHNWTADSTPYGGNTPTGWNGTDTVVPLQIPLVYYHDAGSKLRRDIVLLDDRAGFMNSATGLSPYSGSKSLYLGAADNSSISTIYSDYFSVSPGEIYYISFVSMMGYSSSSPWPVAPGPGQGLRAQIEWTMITSDGYKQTQTEDLVDYPYHPYNSSWEAFETNLKCPKYVVDPNDNFDSTPHWPATAAKGRIIFQNIGSNNVPIWLDDVRVVDTKHHKWHHGYFNPGIATKWHPVYLPKLHDAYVVPVSSYPEDTANVNTMTYVEDSPREISNRLNFDAHLKLADSYSTAGIAYCNVDIGVAIPIQPTEFYLLRVNGPNSSGTHSESACTVQLIYAVFSGSTWSYTLVGATAANHHLSGDGVKRHHGIRIVHDPSASGTYGQIYGYAFGSSFAQEDCRFQRGVPGLFGGPQNDGNTKISGMQATGMIKNIVITVQYT